MSNEHIPEWAAVVISTIALVVSLLERRSNEKRVEREELRRLLDTFLRPLQAIMDRTHKRFEYLTNGLVTGGELHVLEYAPAMMRDVFEHLPDNRKLFWHFEIGQLQKDDQDAVDLIRQYSNRSRVHPRFQKACASFDEHATNWIGRWNYVLQIEARNLGVELNEPVADPFPQSFEPALLAEVERVKKEAGLDRLI